MRKTIAALALSLGTVGFAAGPALADDYAGNNPNGAVSAGSIGVGESVNFTADCFVSGSSVTISVTGPASAEVKTDTETGTNSATAVADAEGEVRATVKPSAVGDYKITANGARTCATGDATADVKVLSATGSNNGSGNNSGSGNSGSGNSGSGNSGSGNSGSGNSGSGNSGSGNSGSGNSGSGNSGKSGSLAYTGVDNVAVQLGLGAGLVGAGIGAVYMVRRRANA